MPSRLIASAIYGTKFLEIDEHLGSFSACLFYEGTMKGIQCKVPRPVVMTRHLHLFSDFLHLLKNLRNAFVTKGLIPGGYANVGFIWAAWKNDNKNVSFKVMTTITLAPMHLKKWEWDLPFCCSVMRSSREFFCTWTRLKKPAVQRYSGSYAVLH